MPFSQMSAIMLCEKIFGGVYLFQQETPQKGYILLPKYIHSGKTIPGRKPAQFIRKECEELMKKIWKRSLSLFLAFVMVFGMLPVSAFADETEPVITEETSVTEPVAAEAAEPPVEETTAPVTEAPVVETTVPVTEAPVVETTVPETEAPVVETTVPVTEAPVVETTVPETEAPETETTEPVTGAPAQKPLTENKVSDSAANSVAEAPSEPEETEAEETEPEETEPEVRKPVRGKLPVTHVSAGTDLPENDELFAGYADHIWFGTEIAPYGIRGRDRLNEDTKIVYDALAPILRQIARGERDTALIKVGTTLDAEDPFFVADADVYFDENAIDFNALYTALLSDMPYEMYWHNYERSTGEYVDGTEISGGLVLDAWYNEYTPENEEPYYEYLYYFHFSVAKPFRTSDVTSIERYDEYGEYIGLEYVQCTPDVSETSKVTATAANAQAVVNTVVADSDVKTDYDKLLAYKNWICDNTAYDKEAADTYGSFAENINPWQIVSVFDNDPNTKVVCEGYSKAFQYLCELTFSKENPADETVTCYSVSGTMTSTADTVGNGAHMWNIVEVNGIRYLADITNSDTSSVGSDGSLFLVGTTPDSNGAYTFNTVNNSTSTFTYDEGTKNLWDWGEADSILNLSSTNCPNNMSQADFKAGLDAAYGSWYYLDRDVRLTSDMTIDLGEKAWSGYLVIQEGTSLTVPSGVTLTLNNHVDVYGSLIVEAGGQLILNNSNLMITVEGGTFSVADGNSVVFNASNCAIVDVLGSNAQISDCIPESNTVAMSSVTTFEGLQEAVQLTGYGSYNIQMTGSFSVTEDITIPADTQMNLMPNVTLTISNNATMTVAGSVFALNSAAAIVIDEGATLTTIENGRVSAVKDYFTNNGTVSGNVDVDSGTTIDPSATMTQEEFRAELAANAGTEYTLTKSVTITEDMTISMATAENPQYHSIRVPAGVTLTVTNNAILTLETSLMIDGGTVIVEDGSKLVLGTSGYFSDTYIWSGTLDIASESGLDMSRGRLTVLYDQGILPDWLNPADITIQYYIRSQSDLEAALNVTGYGNIMLFVQHDIIIDQDCTLANNQQLFVQSNYSLTVAEGTTLTIPGSGALFIAQNASLNNNGRILCYGSFQSYGTINGNEVESFSFTQADFAAAVAEAAKNGETYELNGTVTLTEDMVIASNVNIGQLGSLTVANGAKLTIRNTNSNELAQVIIAGGTMTVQNGATLTIESMMQVGGILTVEAGATVNAGDDSIWRNVTDGGVVNGIDYSRLGATYGVETAEEMEAAYNETNTYAAIHVYVNQDITLDRNITIPAGDDLNEMLELTVTVPANYTLTNNGTINIHANNRLEVLKDGALVNNGTINIDQYAQLYYYKGTLTDTGTIQGAGDIVSSEMSHQELIDALAVCEEKGSSWVHEAETTLVNNETTNGVLKISMGGGDPAPEFYLVEGGVLRVPSGTRLEVYNPLIVLEGGKVIVEEGGTLYVDGTLSVEGGTVYIEEGGAFDTTSWDHVQGRITWEGDTDPWLSETWLDNRDEGWYWPEENILHEAHGLHVMNHHWRIYFLNTWDAENLQWNRVPVIPTENSEYMTITRILDMEDQFIRGDQEFAEYFVFVDVFDTMEHQDVTLFVDGNPYPYELFEHTAGFYSAPEVSMDTFIADGHHSMSGETDEEAVYWLVKEPEYFDVLNFSWNLETWGEDYTQYTGGDPLVVLDDSQAEQGIYKFVIDPDYVEYTKFNWKNFNLQIHMELDDNRDGENNINIEYWDRDIWIEPAPQAEPKAHLRINNQTYLFFENNIIYRDYFTGEYDEQGNEIWDREQCSLPEGVSYVLEGNKLILDNAHLECLELAYMDCWEDDNGYHEEQRLPSADLSLVVYGENSIMNDSECAMTIRNGTNVNISGTGSLHLYAENSPDNNNEEGNRYAYPTVRINDGSSLNLSGGVTVTAEIDGSGLHGDMPAQMSAIDGYSENPASGNTLTISGNAVLTIVTPEGMRTLDESQENYGGARGIVSVSIAVNDNATLNTGSIYLWDGVDFTMNGGTVNLDPIGEVFYNYRLEDWLLSNLGIYLEHEDSVFTMNGGTINMDLNPNEENDGNFNYNTFQGINAALGHVYINGGEININGENAMGGNGIAIQCGPDETAPASSLSITGGTVNISGAEGEFESIFVAPFADAVLSGGTVNAYGGENYFVGSVEWTGNTQLNGDTYVMEGAEIIVKNGATMTIDQTTTVKEGGRIIVENGGTLYVRGNLFIDGTVYIRTGGTFSTAPGHYVEGRITFEGDTSPYLTETWLDNSNGTGWYWPEENELHEAYGLHAMDQHWRIYFLNTWDANELKWNAAPVIPTGSSTADYSITVTPIMEMEDQTIREDQEYAEYFVCVDVSGTLEYQMARLYANDFTFPYEIYERRDGFYTAPEATLDNFIQNHHFTLNPAAEENAVYWILMDPSSYNVVGDLEVSLNTWDQDYTQYIPEGEKLVTMDDSRKSEGIYKFTIHPDYVDYVQYNWKNFDLNVRATVDPIDEDENNFETWEWDVWIDAPELKDPAAALNIDNTEYMIFDTGRIFQDVFAGYNDQGHEIWNRQETALPDGVSYELDKNKIILDGVDLTSLNLKPSASGYDENGNFWEVFGLPKENLTISLVGESSIVNHCGPAVMIEHGMNVTVTGNGSLYAKTTNYPDYRDENGELQCFNTINVYGGSTLTIGGNATVTAELSGHGYWGNGEAATCHAISGSYEGDALVIIDNATVTTVLPNGVRRYDNTGKTSQIGGYVGIQNFNTVTVSGGTLNTDHLNFYNGGQFNLTGGVANFRDLGGINSFTDKEGNDVTECHYEGINMRGGSVNISGGTLNIDVTASESDNCTFSGFYGINVVNGTMDVTGGEINITANTDGWAILADCEWTEEGWVEGTGSTFGITGGTIHVNNADRTYHGGILISEICSGYFGGGEINDDYGIHRFCGDTVWENTVLNGIAANVYTHGPGNFSMHDGQINLTGDSYEENGEVIRNRAIFEINGGGSIDGGKLNLTNGTYINNMNLTIDGGEITIRNDWEDVPGLENYVYFATSGGIIDITANGPAIVSGGTFHQMGGEITAVNTSGTRPAMISTGSTMLNTGVLTLNSFDGVGLYQGYDIELAGTEDESMLFVGSVTEAPAPELNINSKYGLYLNSPSFITGGANVNIHVQGEPINEDMDWPIGIFVEKFTGNEDGSGENVSGLVITGGANVNLVSEDTAGVDAMSKGIVTLYSPVRIQGEGEDAASVPKVTIDAEMAVYSLSDSPEETNFNEGIAFFDRYGAQVALSSRELTETEETGDYLHTLMDGESYIGFATVGQSSVMSLDEFLAAVAEAAANNEYYMLTRNVVVDRDAVLPGGIMIGNGAELIVKDGAVLTNTMEIQVWKNGRLTVEAGGRLDNQGALNAEGTIHISDEGDYAGYVHNTEQFKVGIYAYGTELPSITGIPEDVSILHAECATEDQVNYILSICGGYSETQIRLTEDMVLHTMTIPKNVWLNTLPDLTITVAEGAFLTVNGGLNTRNSDLVVNGKLISNSEMTFNLSEVTINGTFDSNAPLFINDGSVMTVNGTLNSYAPLHVGFWRNPNTEAIAGTLNINGTLNNYAYLNICPDFYIEADNRYCGGIVNVNEGGTLDNTFDADAKVSGYVDLGGTLNVRGTMMNGQLTEVRGSLHLYGKLDNGGTIRLYDLVKPELVTHQGAELINNTHIGNFSREGVISLAEGTYTQGSHTYQDGTTELGELDARFFDDQYMAQIEGAPEGMVSIFYEGSNAEALLAASEAYNWGEGYYDRCFLRVVDDMTFPAGKELNLAEGTYLVVLNNGNNYKGSLTVKGAIFNQSYLRLFGADMTIPEGGWITNKGAIEAGTMTYEKVTDEGEEMTTEIITLKPTVTVGGLLENASTAKLDLSKAEVVRVEPGVIQNNLAGGNLGNIAGIPVSEQTLFSDIDNGNQAHLQELIGMVQNDGYHGGYFWISKDLHITSSTVIPGNVYLSVQDRATLTIDPGVVLQLDSSINVDAGGNLVIDGILGVGGTVDVRGTMTVNGEVGTGNDATVTVHDTGVLNVTGYYGVNGGALDVQGTLNNNGTVSVTWTEERTGNISDNVDPSKVAVWMPFNDRFPNHDEADIAAMLAFAQEHGYPKTTIQFTIDYSFTDSFTVPQGMTFEVGNYRDEQNYRAATVTIPAGKTLTIDGEVKVAKKSALVFEGDAQVIRNGSFYASGNCTDTISWVLENEVLTIEGTGDMLDYAENSAPWAEYASLIQSVQVTLSVPADIQDPESLVVLRYHDSKEEELERTVFQKEDGVWYVSFEMDSYSDYAIVEKSSVVEEVVEIAHYGQNLRLQDLIKIGYYFTVKTDATVEEVGALLWTEEQYNSETDFTVNSTSAKIYSDLQPSSGYYVVETDGIYAQNLGDTYYMIPYARTSSGYTYGTVKAYKALDYIQGVYAQQSSSWANVRSLVIDLANYGTAAREYFCIVEGLETPDEPFNSFMSAEDRTVTWDSSLAAEYPVVSEVGSFTSTLYGRNVNLLDAISAGMYFTNGKQISGAYYWDEAAYTANSIHDSTTKSGDALIEDAGSGYAKTSVTGLFAYNIYDNYYVRVYNADGALSDTYGISVAGYLTAAINAYGTKTDTTSQSVVSLCKAMLVYGDNARNNPSIKK